jgi:redox-sensitive bicupin YhaK (pirin superfamily)
MAAPEAVIVAPVRHLDAELTVRRALPSMRRRMVGSFVFLDQMGPTVLAPGRGIDVRPHPHIGLATVTYLFEGEILHRDSLGSVQLIRPGEVNWMSAGRGIVHSERSPPEARAAGPRLSGIQLWVALPREHEQMEPEFSHTPANALPVVEDRGLHVRVVLGSAFGARSPVRLLSELFYAAATLEQGARLPLSTDQPERALYLAEGAVNVGGERYESGTLIVFRKGDEAVVEALSPARLLVLGGQPADGPRHIYWNFVASTREQIEAAKADWRAGRFPPVPGETELIPLPDDPPPVHYP